MADEYNIEAETNAVDASQRKVKISCEEWWEMAQQWAYTRISWKSSATLRARLIDDRVQRAKMIAGVYARFYLEIEKRGDPSKRGRYYWMGLGAFASKTVHYSLLDKRSSATSEAIRASKVLGKGNLWLFMDIAPTHLNYSHATEGGTPPDSFNKCIAKRDTRTFKQPKVVSAMQRMPDGVEVLPKIDFLRPSGYIKTGFKLVTEIENISDPVLRRPKQLEQLLAIAQHEQEIVLQRVCWNDPVLRSAMNTLRTGNEWIGGIPLINKMLPILQLVFSHEEDVDADKPELKSVMPKGTIVEDLRSRMLWITDAARQYHGLMDPDVRKGKLKYMEGELRTIAGWWTALGGLTPKIPVETRGSAEHPNRGSQR